MPHLLKRLELNGFKSFAQKTVLEFPGGITAIVGPNGSGKSNIIDAVRWLLGEREAKNLRGVKAEDLIFAGTPSRSRLGQAQAGLFFENQGKVFPVDFEEVAVTRQVSRDGTNHYFLNKSEVRLKDLIDFFARGRLGTKGMVVVSQGNSDVFIAAAPFMRREMIEEMLGLREYQLKKSEAIRRLKNAEINLEKARALIDEIAPHLRSLKRQTNRWEKREAVAAELKTTEDNFFGFKLRTINREIANIDHEVSRRNEERNALQKEEAEAEKRLHHVEASQPKERAELSKIRDAARKLSEKRIELQKKVGRLEAQLETGHTTRTAAVSSEKLLHLVHTVRQRLEDSLEEDFVELREVVADIVREIDEMLRESGRATIEARQSELRPQFQSVQQDLESIEKDVDSLRAKEKELEKNQEAFYRTFKEAVHAAEKAKDAIEQWERENRERLFAKERFLLQRGEVEKQIAQAGRAVSEFSHAAEDAAFSEEELGEMERKMFKYRGDLASIGEIDQALVEEMRETEARHQFLERESNDLEKAKADLSGLIAELSEKVTRIFKLSLAQINDEFNTFFRLMFGGGHAALKLEKPLRKKEAAFELKEGEEGETAAGSSLDKNQQEEGGEEGIEISVTLPRKKINSLEMLSGGERSLVGIAALFALISVSPPPFLVLDEIDAALDDRNARRFAEMLKEFSHKTQFIVVTHNRATMEVADVLYGITMNQDGTSKVLSLKLQPAVS